ncbi:MAG TPA: TonB-dependent receptor, partial [Hellea balneolensis]|nr:TonB-dependent receptor [Hellea balneolensis]
MNNKRFLLGTSILITTLMTAPAYAQVKDEIIVTATKRQQTLQEIPVAVSVTDADVIEKAKIADIMDLQTVVPSLRVSQLQNSVQTTFIIRGFGNGANNPGIEPSVGVFIDGVYRSRSAGAIADLPRLERVEVLRGPQSTLFGKNASAGVISVITAKPSHTFTGSVEASYGNYNALGLKGYVSGPISENLAFSLSGGLSKRDGYFKNLAGGADQNDRDRWNLRGQLLFEPTDNASFRLIVDHDEIDEICCGVANLLNGPTGAAVVAVGGNLVPNDPFAREGY